jgi:hypothetical protein
MYIHKKPFRLVTYDLEKAKDERHAKPKDCPNPIREETKRPLT